MHLDFGSSSSISFNKVLAMMTQSVVTRNNEATVPGADGPDCADNSFNAPNQPQKREVSPMPDQQIVESKKFRSPWALYGIEAVLVCDSSTTFPRL